MRLRHRANRILSVLIGSVVLLTLLNGCEFNPGRVVHSIDCPPDHTTDDGIDWVALKVAGDNDEWFYVPAEIAVIEGVRVPSNGFPLDILVKGKIFRIIRSGSVYSFSGQVDSDISANIGTIVISIGFALGFLLTGGYAVSITAVLKSEKEKATAARREVNEYKSNRSRCEKEIEQQREHLQQLRQEFEATQAKATSELAVEREDLDKQKKTHALAARAVQLNRHTPSRDEWEQMGKAVRAEQFRGTGSSREVTVQYFFDPKTSGAAVIDWEITMDRPQPPTLIVFRDGKKIRREAGTFKGRFNMRLLSRTKRYRLLFKVIDGKRIYPDPLMIEIIAPPFDAWQEPPKTPKEKAQQTRDEWIAEQVAWLKKAGTWPADEKAQKDLMAKIEAEAMTKFGEAE